MDDTVKPRLFIDRHERFILTTHEGPDADGIGAEIALAGVLRTMGKMVRIINSNEPPAKYAFMDPQKLLEIFSADRHGSFADTAALVVLDSSDRHHLGLVSDELVPKAAELFSIDHHERPKREPLEGWIDSKASSTCEMIARLADALGVPLDGAAADAAYAGIVFDTGSFVYPKTTARTLRVAVKLVEAGVVPNRIYQSMYESASIGSLLLQKRVIATLELLCGGRLAVQTMGREDLEASGAGMDEADSLINIPLRCKEVEVSVLFKETPEGRLRGSLRSKGRVNVSEIAQHFGGGGHRTAAGFKCAKGLAETKAEVLQKVSAALEAASIGCT